MIATAYHKPLNGRDRLPRVLAFTDPQRSPNPLALAARLPKGAALVYRHFGAKDRDAVARRLRQITRRRGVALAIGADAALARAVGADGLHLPERALTGAGTGGRRRFRGWVTAAAHSPAAMRRAACAGVDGVVLSPVFPSQSPSAGRPIGAIRAGAMARRLNLRVFALGGVRTKQAKRLKELGFWGYAGVGAFAD